MDQHGLSATFAELTADDSERYAPFLWQMRLLRRLIDSDLPRVVDIPTGLGKTSVPAIVTAEFSGGNPSWMGVRYILFICVPSDNF